MKSFPFVILGAGSWGTALALHLAKQDHPVLLWDRNPKAVASMAQSRCNHRYLPAYPFPESLQLSSDLPKAISMARDLLIAVPSHAFADILQQIKSSLATDTRILWATKGIDPTSHQLLHVVTEKILGQRSVAALVGPSFATEVAAGLPTAVVVAHNDDRFAADIVKLFNYDRFRVYTTIDLVGAQLAAAVKNVIAIAAGISDGLGFGANSLSALITRGLAEITRLGIAMGANLQTFIGLAGVGDLVLTCTDNQSRNRRLGLAIAKGVDLKTAETEIGQVIEGIKTAFQVEFLAHQHHVEMPISCQVARVLRGEVTVKVAIDQLFSRNPRNE